MLTKRDEIDSFFTAAGNDQIEVVKFWLKNGVDVNVENE